MFTKRLQHQSTLPSLTPTTAQVHATLCVSSLGEVAAHGHGITVAAAANTAKILTVTTDSCRAAATNSTVRNTSFPSALCFSKGLKRDNLPSVGAGAILAQEASILILFALSLVEEVGQETRLFG